MVVVLDYGSKVDGMGPVGLRTEEAKMLYWALIFLLVALVAGFLGFGSVSFAAAGIAKILFFVFLVVFLISLIMGLKTRGGPTV